MAGIYGLTANIKSVTRKESGKELDIFIFLRLRVFA